MQISRFFLIILWIFIIPAVCQAADIDSLKSDFLQGNYRRVIFEGKAKVNQLDLAQADELNYILGLSYLKEAKLEQAQECFKLVLANSSSKLRKQAELGLADTYLMGRHFQDAENIYNKLINHEQNNSQRAAILYRLSQLEFEQGNAQAGNDYLAKLKKEFPLSPELRINRPLILIAAPLSAPQDNGEYSVQVGFFTNRSNADALKDKLLARDFPAYLENTGAGYRVKVGRLKALSDAQALDLKLSKEGFQTKICP